MAIFITGDLHGNMDIQKLTVDNFPEGTLLTKNDYIIICGDFGLVWDNSKSEIWWREWLSEKPWTTLFIDGNHENFPLLYSFPEVEKFGNKVRKITDSIYHLQRGYVYDIDGIKFFTFGGGYSIDKDLRIEGVSWWVEEMPNKEEYQRGRKELEKHNDEVDIIITHTVPDSILMYLLQTNKIFPLKNSCYGEMELNVYLDSIYKRIKFKKWYAGHMHIDLKINDKFRLLYYDIVNVKKELKNVSNSN